MLSQGWEVDAMSNFSSTYSMISGTAKSRDPAGGKGLGSAERFPGAVLSSLRQVSFEESTE
jgi:hypothetical protein